jgi:transcriptional regulator with XRE-family HTH domain
MIDLFNPLYAKTDEEVLAELGKLLKIKRIKSNYTQRELADVVGISKDQLSKIERTGKTSLATLVAVSRKFGLLNQLLAIYEMPELTPVEKYELEQKTNKLKSNRKRVRK